MWFSQTESYPEAIANMSFCRFSWRDSIASPILGPLLSLSVFSSTNLSANLRGSFYAEPLMHNLVEKPVTWVHGGYSPYFSLEWGWFSLIISTRDGIRGNYGIGIKIWLPKGSHIDSILMSALGIKRLFWNPAKRVLVMGKVNSSS